MGRPGIQPVESPRVGDQSGCLLGVEKDFLIQDIVRGHLQSVVRVGDGEAMFFPANMRALACRVASVGRRVGCDPFDGAFDDGAGRKVVIDPDGGVQFTRKVFAVN